MSIHDLPPVPAREFSGGEVNAVLLVLTVCYYSPIFDGYTTQQYSSVSMQSDEVWFEFVESKIFSRQVRNLAPELLVCIQSDLMQNPRRGDLVKGTHGVRKARVADPTSHRGKSGSHRYLYLYLEHADRIYLLYLFAKGEQADLSPEQKQIIGSLSQQIKKETAHENGKD